MSASRIILVLVALLAGGLAAYIATQSSAPQVVVQEVAAPPAAPAEQVLVAKEPIGVGQRLTDKDIEWQNWPEPVPAGFVSKAASPDALTQMADAVARFEFFPGEPILEQKLVRSGQGYLSAVLEKGMRGVSVQVNANAASGGFIFPNDRVDVVLSRGSAQGAMVSQTILSNVKVLAIGRRLGETGKTGKPSDPEDPGADVFQDSTIATLELDPSRGEMLINASKTGSLSLVLRSIADFEASTETVQQQEATSRAIRVIRAGKGVDVQTASADASYAPATGADQPEPAGSAQPQGQASQQTGAQGSGQPATGRISVSAPPSASESMVQ